MQKYSVCVRNTTNPNWNSSYWCVSNSVQPSRFSCALTIPWKGGVWVQSTLYIFKKKTNCHSVPVQSYCGTILLCSIIWPWIAWQQLYQQPYHTQSCCAGRTEEWWRLGRRRQWKSSYSRLEQSIWRGRQKRYLYVMWGCSHARCDFSWIIFLKINKWILTQKERH